MCIRDSLVCALAGTASAAPTGSFEESASAASDEIRAHTRKLSATLRSSLTPELRSALVERFAPGRPEPHVRGRSLAAENICLWEQGDEDYDFAYLCNLQPSVVNNFKPASREGRTGFEVLKPIVTCLDIKLEDECRAKPSCTEEKFTPPVGRLLVRRPSQKFTEGGPTPSSAFRVKPEK